MNMLMRPRFLLVLFAMLLAGCAAQTRFVHTWHDPAHAGSRVGSVLVMAFGDDGASRRVFEDEFVRTLNAAGVRALASYTLVPGIAGADWPRVKEAVDRSAAGAVLTVRLVGIEKWTRVVPAQVMMMPVAGPRRGLSGYYTTVMVTPPTTQTFEVMTLETSLWKVPGESMVWSGTSETFAPDDLKEAAGGLAREVVQALRAQGLF